MPIAESNLRRHLAERGPKRRGLIDPDQNPRRLDKASGSPPKRGNLSPQHQIRPQKLLEERLHHDAGVGREHAAPAAGGEDPPRFRVEVPGVELGQHRARHRLYVGDPQPGEGREDEHLDPGGLRYEVVEEPRERREQEEEEEAESAAGFEGDQCKVGEGAPPPQQRPVHVRHHGGVVSPHRGAIVDAAETRRRRSHD